MPARHRLSNWLLRHEIVYSDGQAWAGAHDAWVRRQRFGLPLVQATFDEGYDSVVTIAAMDADSPWTGTVHRPGCLRGISTLTGFALAVEIGGWSRFTGNSIGAIRETPMSSTVVFFTSVPRSILDTRSAPAEHRPAVPNPRISV